MKNKTKILAYQAINENVKDTTARTIIKYVMECELLGQDVVSPTNEYLANKFNWKIETVRVAISKAKKSQLITTTGSRNNRCFELNIGYLKGKIAEINQRKIFRKNSLNKFKNEFNLKPIKNKPNDQKREFTGVWIPSHILEDTALRSVDKILYAIIACPEMHQKKSNELMEFCGVRKKAFQASCRRLEKLGYIEEKRVFGRIQRNISLVRC